MTSTNMPLKVLKQEARGRVWVAAPRREALLDEFERSGVSGAKFARLVGIKYPTFAGWVHRRRCARGENAGVAGEPEALGSEALASGGPVRLFEAMVEAGPDAGRAARDGGGLQIELPGGCRARIDSPAHLELVAELVTLLAQRACARC
jgi:hypothetical protein